MCLTEKLLTTEDKKLHYQIKRCPPLGTNISTTACHSPSSISHLAITHRIGSIRMNPDLSLPASTPNALSAQKLKLLKHAFRRKCARRELLIWARGAPLLELVSNAMEADKKEAEGFKVMDGISSDPSSPNAYLRMVEAESLPAEDRECPICTEAYVDGMYERAATKLPCGHAACAQCLQTWTMGISAEANPQKQCPICRTVFYSGAPDCAHHAQERENLAYAMIRGINVPSEFVECYAKDVQELAQTMGGYGMNLSEADFKNLDDMRKDGDEELEGGIDALPHTSAAIAAPAEDPYNFWNCFVPAGKLPTGPVGLYLHTLLASEDWRQAFGKEYKSEKMFGPESMATTALVELFEMRLGVVAHGVGVVGRRTREVLSGNVEWRGDERPSALDAAESLELKPLGRRKNGTVEMEGMQDLEGEVFATEMDWEDVDE